MADNHDYDPQKQFSKWLAKSGSVYWICFLSAILIVITIRPEAATACVWLVLIVSFVVIVHVWAYTKNSTYEKGLRYGLEKLKMEMSLRASNIISNVMGKQKKEEDEDEDSGEGGNG